ncbi:hypothetical protein TN98_01195 [Pantoea anthophila]|nr:hypothetical protein TN98_01195 [Pantoea anthophila]
MEPIQGLRKGTEKRRRQPEQILGVEKAGFSQRKQNREVIITGRSLTAIIEGFLRGAQDMAPGGTCLNVST